MESKEVLKGILIVLAAIGVVYISLNGQVRLRIDQNQAIFYVNESRWLISGIQNDRLFKGASIIDRVINSIVRLNYTEEDQRVEYRETTYENGEVLIHTWNFDIDTSYVEDFPISEDICIYNAKGKYYRYSLDRLTDPGPKRKLTTETSARFGRNMNVEFEPGYSWGWIGWPYGSDSFSVQYKITSDSQCHKIRFFDPPKSMVLNDGSKITTSKNNKSMEIKDGDDYSLFNITSSTPHYLIGDFAKTKEWGYEKAGFETIECNDGCFLYKDNICNNNIVSRNLFTNSYLCTYYTPINRTNITVSNRTGIVYFKDNYDPTIIIINITIGVFNKTIAGGSGAGVEIVSNISLNTDLLGFWDFNTDRLGQTTCNDLSGNSHDGTVRGGSIGIISDGFNGRAYADDGIDTNDEGCAIPSANHNMGAIGNFTIFAIINATGTKESGIFYTCNPNSCGVNLRWSGFTLRVRAHGLSDHESNWNGAFTLNQWAYVFGFYNGSDLCIQVNDGIAECDPSTGNITTGIENVHIGSDRGTVAPWNGSISTVMLWNRSLTTEERTSIYSSNIYEPSGSYLTEVQNITSNNSLRSLDNITWNSTEPTGTNIGVSVSTKTLNITDDLLAYWDFDGDDYGTSTCNDIWANNDGVTQPQSVGIIADGFDRRGYFDDGVDNDANGCVIASNNFASIKSNFTIFFRAKKSGIATSDYVFNFNGDIYLIQVGGGVMTLHVESLSDTGSNSMNNLLIKDEWISAFAFYNSSHLCWYNGSDTECDASTGTPGTAVGDAVIGARHTHVSNNWNGSIDDLMIWNRSLSLDEMDCIISGQCLTNWTDWTPVDSSSPAEYTTTNGTFFQANFTLSGDSNKTPVLYNWTYGYSDISGEPPPDTTAPTVLLTVPINQSILTSNPVDMNFTVNENSDNCSLFLNSTVGANKTIFTVTSATETNFTMNLTNGGHYSWNVSCWDSSNNMGNSTTRNFSVSISVADTEAPQLPPPDNQSLVYATDALSINLNATDNVALDIYFSNETERFNITLQGNLTNVTLVKVGIYFLNISVNDTSGNVNSTIMNINVTQATASVNLQLNGSDSTYTQSSGYINITGYMITPPVGTINFTQNGTHFQTGADRIQNITNWSTGHYNMSVIFFGNENYTAAQDSQTLIISLVDPCDCPVIDNDFTVPTGCNLITPCVLGTGRLNHSGSGSSICNTTITYSNRIQPPNGYVWRIAENCYMNVTG